MSKRDLPTGTVVDGRYRIEGEIGHGGFAVVYDGMDLRTQRRVAIKIVHDVDPDPKMRARFQREIEAVARLDDPHIVKMFAHGKIDGRPYVVLEHVQGRDLSEVIAQHRTLPPEVVERVMRQALIALRAAHQQGLVHRDIKPSNIRIYEHEGDPWRVKVLDFGLARRWDPSRPVLTSTGELVGTPRYMAPEQLLEQPLGPSTDLYSLGLVAFELLAGAEVLGGNSWNDQLERLQSGHLFAVAQVPAASRLHGIIQSMIARAPRDRFQSAEAVLRALDAPARPVATRNARHPSGGKEHRAALVGLAVVVAGLMAVIGLTTQPDREPPTPRRSVTTSTVKRVVPAAPAPIEVREATPPTAQDADGDLGTGSGCGLTTSLHGLSTLDTWRIYVPTGYDSSHAHPLLMLLHAEFQSPDELLLGSGFMKLADEKRFVIVAPRDVDDDFGENAWSDDKNKDARWLRAVADATANELCIDPSRIYAVSHSDAGKAVETLTCADWVAALATNSFRRKSIGPSCEANPTPYLMLSPRHSRHAPFDGGADAGCLVKPKRSVAELEDYWRKLNGCQGERRESMQHEKSVCYTWACAQPFESCHLEGGHPWPGTKKIAMLDIIGDCQGDAPNFPTTAYVWSFLERFTKTPAAEDRRARDDANTDE